MNIINSYNNIKSNYQISNSNVRNCPSMRGLTQDVAEFSGNLPERTDCDNDSNKPLFVIGFLKHHLEIELNDNFKKGNIRNIFAIQKVRPEKETIASKFNVILDLQDDIMKLGETDQEKFILLNQVLRQIVFCSKTKKGVTDEYFKNFLKELMRMDNILLKNVVENSIPIFIYDDMAFYPPKLTSHAHYAHSHDGRIKALQFAERMLDHPIKVNGNTVNTYDSLAHELGHAFDYNNGTKLGLTPQDFISEINGESFSRMTHLASFSKEFDDAFTADYIHMMELDNSQGKPEGTTFDELLKNKNFNYYFGVGTNKYCKKGFNDISARKELFAQCVSYITTGKVTSEEFSQRFEELFPNLLDFTKKVLTPNK